MNKKTQDQLEHEKAKLEQIMKSIKQLLPEGYLVTNLYPVMKQIRKNNGSVAETFWTCWVKKDSMRYLAVLKGDRVKLISHDELNEYQLHTIRSHND
jgi:hypothetical protein